MDDVESSPPATAGAPGPLRDALALAALATLGFAFTYEMATLHGVPVARDVQFFFVPHKHILWRALQDATLPLWTSLIGTGAPVLANFQSGVFYPPHWLYGIASFLAAFNWLIVLHLMLAGFGMYALCRQVRFSRAASWLAAVSFMLGGYLVSLTNLVNALQAAAWVPLMAVTLLRQARSPGPVSFGLVVVVHLLAFLAGAPYTFLIGAGLSAGYCLVRAYDSEALSGRVALLSLSCAAVAVAGLSAVQILPTLELVSESTRAGGVSLQVAGTYSTEPVRLLHLVFPNDFSDPTYNFGHKLQITDRPPWLYSIYLGLVPLLLALFAPLDEGRRREVAFWAGAAAFGLVLALGPHTPVFGLLHRHVPGFGGFRFPEKFFLLIGFSVPVLAAHGFSVLRSGGGTPGTRWRLIAAGATAVALLGGTALWTVESELARSAITTVFSGRPAAENPGFAHATWATTLRRLAILFGSAVVVIGLYRRERLRETVAVPLLVLLVAGDLWLAHRHLIPTVDPAFYREQPDVTRLLPEQELRTQYRYKSTPIDGDVEIPFPSPPFAISTVKWLAQQTLHPNTGALHGLQTVDSGDALHVLRTQQRRDLMGQLPDRLRWRLLELHSVRYFFSTRDHDPRHYAGRTALDSFPGHVYRLDDPAPRAYVASGTVRRPGRPVLDALLRSPPPGPRPVVLAGDSTGAPAASLRGWAESAPEFRLDRALSDSLRPAGTRPGGGTAEIARDAGSEVAVRVDPAASGFLLLTDTHYPGWRAYVDGEQRPVLRANYFFRAVPVRPGDETVVFRYEPTRLELGGWLSGLSLVLLVGGLVGWARRRESPVAGRES